MAAISPITLVFNAVDQATPILRNLVSQVQTQFGVVAQLSNAYNEITGAFQQLAAVGGQAYQKLIGQNVELQNQLLSTQATLVATNKVIENGFEIKDPTKAIQSLTEPVNQAIAQLRQGSLELVGVTSAELIPLFQLTAQASASIGANLSQSADLTLSFAAALGTLQIPLFQAQQELNSIYQGQITSDSQLAKSLGLNNEMVNKWKAQGVFVEKITERLGAFRAGNALAAQTIDGITSNIEELVDEVSRVAGAPLLQPIVVQLDNLYKFLSANKETIQDIAVTVVNFFLGIGEKLGQVFTSLEPVFKTLGESLFKQISAEADAAGKVITILVDSFVLLVQAATPLLQVIANISLAFANLASTDLGGILLQATLLTAVIGNLSIKLIAFTAIQLVPFLLSLVPAFIGAIEAVKLFWLAINGSTGAQLALSLLVPVLGQVTAAFVAAGGGVAGFLAAANTLLAVPVIMGAIAAGVAVAATGLALMVKNMNDLRVVTEELEDFRKTNDDLTASALRTAEGLKAINKAERENGTITKEQEEQRKRLVKTSNIQVEALKSQIQALKELQPVNDEQKNAQEAQIATLQRYIDLLNKQAGGVKLAALDLPKLGNDFEQLGKKLENALSQFDRPASETIFVQSAKEIVDFSAKSVEAGAISAKLAIQKLERVRDDVRVEYEQRLAAQEAIIKLRQGEVDETLDILSQQSQAIERLIAGEIISQVEGQKQITYNKILQLKEQLNAVRQSIKEETKLRNDQIKEQIAGIDKQIAEVTKRRNDALKSRNKQDARLAGEDIAKLQKEKSLAQASLKIDSERLQTLKNQEAKFKTDLDKTVVQQRTEQRQQRLKDFDEQQALLDAANAKKLITEEEYNKKSLDIARRRANEELKVLREQEKKLRPGREGKDGREEIAAKRAAVEKKLSEENSKFQEQQLKLRINRIESEQKVLDASLASGLISQQKFNEESLKISQKRTEIELNEINRKKSKLKPGDSRLQELEGQEAEIRKRQLEAVADNQDKQLVILDKAQKRATDIVSQSEAERNNVIANLEKDELITGARANELRVDNTRKTLESELALEKDKLAALLALPAYTDPVREEQHQSQIRASRLKTTNLTKQLIDNEVQKREAVFRVFEDIKNKEIQAIQNQATAQTQLLENQIKLNDYAAKNLSIQEDLLRSRQDLISAGADYLTGELQILAELTDNESEKKAIAESIALVRLKSVQEQAVFERKILELNIEQTAEALKQERIQLRIDTLKARAATLKAQAEEEKTKADLKSTKGEKEAAALNTDAAIQTEELLGEQANLLDNKKFSNQRKAEYSRIKLRDSSQLKEDQALLNLANSRVDKSQGEREKERLGNNIRNRRYTGDDGSGGSLRINENTGENLRFIRRETDFDLEKFNRDGSLRNPQGTQNNNLEGREATREEIKAAIEQALGRSLGASDQDPQKQVIQDASKTRQSISSLLPVATTRPVPQTQFTGNVPQNTLVNKDGKITPNIGGSTFTVNISNTFSPADVASQKASTTLANQIRGELFDIFTLAGKK